MAETAGSSPDNGDSANRRRGVEENEGQERHLDLSEEHPIEISAWPTQVTTSWPFRISDPRIRARERLGWKRSGERRKLLLAVYVVAITVAIAWSIYTVYLLSMDRKRIDTIVTLPGGLSLFCIASLLLYWRSLKQDFRDRETLHIENEEQKLEGEEAFELGAENDATIRAVWRLANKHLRGYHQQAYQQANSSFWSALIAIICGFAILAAATTITALMTGLSASGNAVIGVIGISGAGLAAYITRTFLRLQETTATQMRLFFGQPQEALRFIMADRFVDRLPEENRTRSIEYLVQAVMLSGMSLEQIRATLSVVGELDLGSSASPNSGEATQKTT